MIWEGIAGTFRVCNVVQEESVDVSNSIKNASAWFELLRLSPPDSNSPLQLRLHPNNKSSLHSYRFVKHRPSKDGLIMKRNNDQTI